MFSEMVNPAIAVNGHDKSINTSRLGGEKPVGCLDKHDFQSVRA